ncbi:MAG: DUF2868 domain-containing protein [Psychromonas sp.]
MNQFESRLLVEGVRASESVSPDQATYATQSNEKIFDVLLFERAKAQDQNLQISSLFEHFNKLTKNLSRLLALLLFILGGLAVQGLLFSEQLTSINFFWAFTLFFIPNLFMLLVWLFLFVKPELLQNSSLTKFTLMMIKQFEQRCNKNTTQRHDYWPLFTCYFNIHFAKKLGRYQLSILTHLLWLSYFMGATLMSVMMLATHQVDFVWQTSILSTDTFQSLTQLLAYVPQQLGFPVPSIEQIQHSHIGNEAVIDAESRRLAWSSLLISSLLLYGLLPRLILLLVMYSQCKQAKVAFQLDLSLPYYVQLRQLLKPNRTILGVSDTDDVDFRCHPEGVFVHKQRQDVTLPSHFYALAIELSTQQLAFAITHLQQNNADPMRLLNVCDYQAQQALLTELKHNKYHDVAIYIALNRLPDRGLKRFMSELTVLKDKHFHLCLIIDKALNKQRDSDWYRLANDVGISFDNILHIEIKGANNE